MSEMVERVARAIAERVAEAVAGYMSPVPPDNWPVDYDDHLLVIYRACARAAIAAMREPTREMIDAGAATIAFPEGAFGPPSIDGQPSKSWRAMIDAAFAEEPK